ncbi:DUF87 domain-containing protein [bacterium]|nr:DUF87 domain-containing protein [bacterium]
MFYNKKPSKNIYNLLDIADCHDDTLVNFDCLPTIGYAIKGIDLFYQTEQSQNAILSRLIRWGESLPNGISLSIHKDTIDNQSTYTIFISIVSQKNIPLINLDKLFPKSFQYKGEKKLPITKDDVFELIGTVEKQLSIIGLSLTRLSNQDLLNWCRKHLNNTNKQHLKTNYSFRSQCFDTPLQVSPESIKIGEKYVTTIVLHQLPSEVNEHLIEHFGKEYVFNISWMTQVTPVKKAELLKYLKKKKHFLQMTTGLFRQLINRHVQSTDELGAINTIEELDEAIHSIALSDETAPIVSMVYKVTADTKEESRKQANSLKNDLNSKYNLTFIIDDYAHLENMLAFIPSHVSHSMRNHLIQTSILPLFIPIYQGYSGLTKNSGPPIYLEKRTGERVPFSFFHPSLKGGHSLIVGQTGGGKSFLVNWLLNNIVQQNDKVLVTIIDKGGSYKNLVDKFQDSYYVDVDLKGSSSLSLFPKNLDETSTYRLQHILYMMIDDDTSKTPSELSLFTLSSLINEFYKSDTETKTVETFYFFLEKKILENPTHEDAAFRQKALKGLSVFAKPESQYYALFNSKVQVPIDKRILAFDLTKLTNFPKLQSIYFFLIQDIIDDRMLNLSKKGYRQIVIYDECWSFLNTPVAATMIDSQYRTARKYGNTILSISQSINDFLSCSCSSGIIENSTVKFILQLGANVDRLADIHINEKEQESVTNLQRVDKKFNEIFVKLTNEGSFVWKLTPNKAEIDTFSRDFQSMQVAEAL